MTELCTHCETRPATMFLAQADDYDPLCAECFKATFADCEQCGGMAPKPLIDVCVARQTHREPAEYLSLCESCAGRGDEDRDERETDDLL